MQEQNFEINGVIYTLQMFPDERHTFVNNSGVILSIDSNGKVTDRLNRTVCNIDYNTKGHFAVFEVNPKNKDLVNFSTYDHDRVNSEVKLLRYILKFNILEYYRGKEKR